MQIDRLLETILFLLRFRRTSAKELAERFQVSIRTIYRDIDTLTLAGIPIYCVRGNQGGVFLDENYLLDRNFLKKNESEQVIFALEMLQSTGIFASDSIINKYRQLGQTSEIQWLSVQLDNIEKESGFEADFSLLKTAIIENKQIQFIYYSERGQTSLRIVSPVRIIFRQNSWSLLVYENSFSIFPIHRMKDIFLLETPSHIPTPITIPDEERIAVHLKFSKRISYKVYAEFYQKEISYNKDGSYEIVLPLLNSDQLPSYILSFGENVEIISPLWLKEKMIKQAKDFLKNNQI